MRTFATSLCTILITGSILCAGEPSRSYRDVPFAQDFSEKVPLDQGLHDAKLLRVRQDRNGRIVILSDKGLLQPHAGKLGRTIFTARSAI